MELQNCSKIAEARDTPKSVCAACKALAAAVFRAQQVEKAGVEGRLLPRTLGLGVLSLELEWQTFVGSL